MYLKNWTSYIQFSRSSGFDMSSIFQMRCIWSFELNISCVFKASDVYIWCVRNCRGCFLCSLYKFYLFNIFEALDKIYPVYSKLWMWGNICTILKALYNLTVILPWLFNNLNSSNGKVIFPRVSDTLALFITHRWSSSIWRFYNKFGFFFSVSYWI